MFHSYAHKERQKTSDFLMLSGGTIGFKWNIGFNKFHNFHLFVLEGTTEICSAK